MGDVINLKGKKKVACEAAVALLAMAATFERGGYPSTHPECKKTLDLVISIIYKCASIEQERADGKATSS